jgi:hypothetical protein
VNSGRALLALAFLVAATAHAQDTDEALAKTKALLESPEQRDAFIQKNAKARAADEQATAAVAGSQADKQELYGIASSIFEDLVKETGGDPEKLTARLTEAQANPEAFFNHLKPEQQARIKAESKKSEDASKPAR